MATKVDAKALLIEALEDERNELVVSMDVLKKDIKKIDDKINLLKTRI